MTPYGKHLLPDIAQSMIENVLKGLDVEVYINDIGIFSDTYEAQMQKVNLVLQRLEPTRLKVNPLKCEWCVQ